jgi:predicted neutral ceramidase superfamily lipid hydrolase
MFSQKMLSDEGFSSLITPMFIVIFILALVISFAIYRCALNFFMQKVDIEEKFESVISKPKK